MKILPTSFARIVGWRQNKTLNFRFLLFFDGSDADYFSFFVFLFFMFDKIYFIIIKTKFNIAYKFKKKKNISMLSGYEDL